MSAKKKTITPAPAPIPDIPVSAPISEEKVLAQVSNEPPLERKNNVLFAVGITVSVAIFVGSILLLVVSLNTPKQTSLLSATPSQAPLPIPSPTPAFQKQRVTFEVLNGSGVAGEAAKAADVITAAGYSVVTIGNAETKRATSELYLSSSVSSFADIMIRDLVTPFGISTVSGALTDSTASARLIIGKK